MDNGEQRLDKTEAVVSAVEKSAQFLSDKYDDMQKESDVEKETVKELVGKVSQAKTESDERRSTLTYIQKVNSELKEDFSI